MLVGIADTFVVSYAEEAAVSGVSLVNSFNTIFILPFHGAGFRSAVIISQYIGRHDTEPAGNRPASFYRIPAAVLRCCGCSHINAAQADPEADVWKSGAGGDGGLRDLFTDLRLFLSGHCGLQCWSGGLQGVGKTEYHHVYFGAIQYHQCHRQCYRCICIKCRRGRCGLSFPGRTNVFCGGNHWSLFP